MSRGRSNKPSLNQGTNVEKQSERAAFFQETHYQGLIPPPDYMEKYEQILPGAMDRILKMAEEEGKDRRSIQREIVKSSFSLQRFGMKCGITAVGVISSLSGYALYLGHPTAAASIAGTIIASLAGVFVFGRKGKSEKLKEEPPSEEK